MPHSRKSSSNSTTSAAFLPTTAQHDVRLNYPAPQVHRSPPSSASTITKGESSGNSPSTSQHPYAYLPSSAASTSLQSSPSYSTAHHGESSNTFWTAPSSTSSSRTTLPDPIVQGEYKPHSQSQRSSSAFLLSDAERRKRETSASLQSLPVDADDQRWSNAPAGSLTPTTLAHLQQVGMSSPLHSSSSGIRVSMAPATISTSLSSRSLEEASSPGGSSGHFRVASPQLPSLSFEMNRGASSSSSISLPYITASSSTSGSITPIGYNAQPTNVGASIMTASQFYDDCSDDADHTQSSVQSSMTHRTPTPASRNLPLDRQFLDYQGKRILPLPGEPSPSQPYASPSIVASPASASSQRPASTASLKGKERARDSFQSSSWQSEGGADTLGGWDQPDDLDADFSSTRRQSKTTNSRRWSRADMLSDRASRDLYASYASADSTRKIGQDDSTLHSTLELSGFPLAPTNERAPSEEKASDDDDGRPEEWRRHIPAITAPPDAVLSNLDFDFGSSSLFSEFDLGLDSLGASLAKRSITPTRVSSDTTSSGSQRSGLSTEQRTRKASSPVSHNLLMRKQPPRVDEDEEYDASADASKRASVMTIRNGDHFTAELANLENQPASRMFPIERPLSPPLQPSADIRPTSRQSRTHSRTTSISSQISAMLDKTIGKPSSTTSGSSRQHSRNTSTALHYNSADSTMDTDSINRDFTSTPPLFAFKGRRSSTSSALSNPLRARSPDSTLMASQLTGATQAQHQRAVNGDSNVSLLSVTSSGHEEGSRRASATGSDVNKSLPPTPAGMRLFSMPKGSRPSFPERASSIRKTSANIITMGKNLMSRSHTAASDNSQSAQQTQNGYGPGIGSRQPSSTSNRPSIRSASSNYPQSNSFSDAYDPASYFNEKEQQTTVDQTESQPKPRLSVRRSMDMLRNKVKGSTSSSDSAAISSFQGNEDQSKAAASKKKLSTAQPAPVDLAESHRRPSTDKLLMLASQKLAKLAMDKSAESSIDSHDANRSPISPISTASTDISSAHHHNKDAPEVYCVAHAVRINRQDVTNPQDIAVDTQTADPIINPNLSPVKIRSAPKLIARRQIGSVDLKTALSPAHTLRKSPSSNFNAPLRSGSLVQSNLSTAIPPLTPQPPPISWKKRNVRVDSGVGSDTVMSAAWLHLEDSLERYIEAYQNADTERPQIASTSLLAFLKRAEIGLERISSTDKLAQRQRSVLFAWLDVLLEELRLTPANRGICLDGVAAVLESCCLSSDLLKGNAEASQRFTETLINALSFAIDKLNEKAVYANTLSFSGRLFAIAFFRIEGIGIKLLRLLPQVGRQDLKRILVEAGVHPGIKPPPIRTDIFPDHLEPLCFKDLPSYAKLLTPMTPADGAVLVETEHVAVKMQGNWLIRWQASDSDLPFAFYRAYHRQLSNYLQIPVMSDPSPEAFLPPYEAISAPGFLFLAASLLEKIDSLVHRNLRSVTTLGPNNGNFSTQDSANMSMGAKPKVLEMANRRVVSTILEVVGGPAKQIAPDTENTVTTEGETRIRRHLFGGMLQVLIRAVVKRTSLFDARGVFLLLDFIEGLFYTVCATPAASTDLAAWHPSPGTLAMFDITFILSFVRTLLLKADNTICLMRTFTFLYAQFESFTIRPDDRFQLCQRILMHPDIFQRMFLFWNMSVRGYFLRLIVWRLSRLGTSSDGRPRDTKDPHTVFILHTLNSRLEGIRKRHDEIDPIENLPDDDLFESARLSIDSTRGVINQLWIVDEIQHKPGLDTYSDFNRSEMYDKAGPEDSRDTPDTYSDQVSGNNLNGKLDFGHAARDVATMSKVVNWLKVLKPGKKGAKQRMIEEAHIQPFTLHTTDDEDPSTFRVIRRDENGHDKHMIEGRASQDAAQILSETDDQEPSQQAFPFSPVSPERDAAFFSFEFEGDVPLSDTFEGRRSIRTSLRNMERPVSQNGAATPRRPTSLSASASPRVSKRFSKRASILPPPALDLLSESSEPVPVVPKEFQNPEPYPMHQHAYAIRGLREYEDALDEYDVWIARVMENDEDLDGREQAELVPRLNVLWPLSFSED